MSGKTLIGLDFGSASARGVLVDAETGRQIDATTRDYRHGTLSNALPDGTRLPRGWALQVAADYLEVAEAILSTLGRSRDVRSIGIGFTASSPMPARADGRALSDLHPEDPHAYVKLWKHAAQSQAARINAEGGAFLTNFGGKLSGEWLLPKAAQIAEEAPESWARADRFIEAGDWLVWQLTGREVRAQGFAAYKAQWSADAGYPAHVVPGLLDRLAPPSPVGTPAGPLAAAWRDRTGIKGHAIVAVAVIDSHVVLPAVGAVEPGTFVGALGTSAVFLYLNDVGRPLPAGIEGVARNGAIRDLWCYEAGTASFGDTLAWFAETFPRGTLAETIDAYTEEAMRLQPGESHLLALDWWSGNRVPFADSGLSGLLLGFTGKTNAVGIWRALMESLCFGTRAVLDLYREGDFPVSRVLMTSGLANRLPALVQMMADVLDCPVEVPQVQNPTALGAAIHGAVAAGLVSSYAEGALRFGATKSEVFHPRPEVSVSYDVLYPRYRALAADPILKEAMRTLDQAIRPTASTASIA